MAKEECKEKCADLLILQNELEIIQKLNNNNINTFEAFRNEIQNLRRDVDRNTNAIDQIKPVLSEIKNLQEIVFQNGITLKSLVDTIKKIEGNVSKQKANITTLLVAAVTSIVGPVVVLVFQFLVDKP